ncbi:PREDICTED: uncharacterized protein LOC108575988 [Habropoda laboriosa]|uniref:uncharacterized protein LOC108575988 n=1 Tax=Habropoda laboriosa TaxID=597456 RepID=UPI00083D8E21|nr:PREDICTED: uncharacterized protein LOC108575988 [Habropoda laboriosa]
MRNSVWYMAVWKLAIKMDWTNNDDIRYSYRHDVPGMGAINGLFCYVIFTSVAITPRVLDLISPKNESRGVDFIYPAYYGLDEEEHYYILMGHMLCVITVVFFVYISCDTIYMSIVQHACGLLNVSGHCFKWAVETVITKNEKMHTEVDDTYRKVRHSIKAHQHAME